MPRRGRPGPDDEQRSESPIELAVRSGAALADASPDAMICADEDGLITFWNASAERLFGLPQASALGRSLDLIVPEPMRGAHEAGMRRLLAGGAPRLAGRVVEVIAQHAIDGRQFPIEMSLALWHEPDGTMAFGAMVRDISERRRNEERLHQLAHYDQLTLLPNRTLLIERLETALVPEIEDPAGDQARPTALFLLDLDGFKDVNDLQGHAAGDELLKEVALRLRRCIVAGGGERDGELVARLGGDEFAILLPGRGDPIAAASFAERMRHALSDQPFLLDGRSVSVGASVGIAVAPAHGATPAELLGNADLALHRAKADGGNRRQVFMPSLRSDATARRGLEAELKRACREGEFELFYQPQVRLADGALAGAEALLRWRHPERGLLAPGAFISVLEEGELAPVLGEWILETACAQGAAWHRRLPGFRMGVNLFAVQLRSSDLASVVRGVLSRTGLPAEALELEITETVVLGDDASWIKRLRRLRDLGVGLAFDDYGTGYASLSLLKRYPVTRLKIDRSFVRDLGGDPGNAAIVETVLSLGTRFGLDVIAEGVETADQERGLLALGCEEAQGYRYGRPVPAATFSASLVDRVPSRSARSAERLG